MGQQNRESLEHTKFLNRCRDTTEEADEVLLRYFGLLDHREVVEVKYRNYMKSGGERPATVRGAAPDHDR